jgi:hypothetical protein
MARWPICITRSYHTPHFIVVVERESRKTCNHAAVLKEQRFFFFQLKQVNLISGVLCSLRAEKKENRSKSHMIDSVFYTTVVSFGLISLFIYLFVLPRLVLLPNNNGGNINNADTAAAAAARGRRGSPTDNDGGDNGNNNSRKPSSTAHQPLCTRTPPHLSEQSARIATWGGMNVLVEGMIPFRYTKAAAIQDQQQKLQQQQPSPSSLLLSKADMVKASAASSSPPSASLSSISSNRKDRARILSNLFHGSTSSSTSSSAADVTAAAAASAAAAPPEKGSTIVISIPSQDLDCPKLRRVLYLLGTYYNILVIIVVDSSVSIQEVSNIRNKLRGDSGEDSGENQKQSVATAAAASAAATDIASPSAISSSSSSSSSYLSADVLPDHRIVAASTVSARVAFARQLARKDLILDFDAEVSEQLMRFGHRVITYGGGGGGNGRRSQSNQQQQRSTEESFGQTQEETGRRVISKLGGLLLQSG